MKLYVIETPIERHKKNKNIFTQGRRKDAGCNEQGHKKDYLYPFFQR